MLLIEDCDCYRIEGSISITNNEEIEFDYIVDSEINGINKQCYNYENSFYTKVIFYEINIEYKIFNIRIKLYVNNWSCIQIFSKTLRQIFILFI